MEYIFACKIPSEQYKDTKNVSLARSKDLENTIDH